MKESEWDDVYYVLTEELELLEIKIDPAGAGTVTTNPAPSEGTQHNWYFPHGTTVYVTAHPKSGYTFKSWSGEMTDTPAITAPVYPMTEKRTITAHFESEVVPPPKADIRNFDFRATGGTYNIGDKVPFTAPYEYKGKAQSGRLTISLGTGVYPSFFTKHTFAPVSVSFKESMDWQGGVINGQFTLPSTLEPGQTYSVRAKLEAISDYTQETDTDWGIITIPSLPEPEFRNMKVVAVTSPVRIGYGCTVVVTFEYRGPTINKQLYAAIGNDGIWGFDEILSGSITVTIQGSTNWVTKGGGVLINVTTEIEPGVYDVYAKLNGVFPDAISPVKRDAVIVVFY
ncbi:hypothetical protein ES705_36398 [subsurface metagenome]